MLLIAMFSTFQIFSFTYPLSCFGCSGAIRNQLYLDTAESGTLLMVLGGLLGASWKADLVVLTLDFLKFPASPWPEIWIEPLDFSPKVFLSMRRGVQEADIH